MGYLIALIPPFLDSVAIYLDKFLLSKYEINPIIITLYAGFFAFFVGLIVLLFTGFSPVDSKSAVIIVASGFLGIFYLLAYFKALTYEEGSRVGALLQLMPVMVIILSFIFLGEKLQVKQYIGAILIIASGFSISLRKSDLGKFKVNKAFWFILLSGAFSATSYVLFKLGVQQINFWQTLPYEGFGSTLAALCILAYGKNFRLLLKTKKIFKGRVLLFMTIIELLSRMSRYILLFALSLIPVSIATVMFGIQPFILLIGGVILTLWFPHIIQEGISKKTVGFKVFAMLVIFVGLYLIFI